MQDIKRKLHLLRLRTRRKVRKQRKQMEGAATQADYSLNTLFFKRLWRLQNVRRFFLGWTTLVIALAVGAIWQVRALDQFYLTTVPANGGIYREGMIGSFTTANPLFAVSPADSSVARLVFSGLFTLSPTGELEPNLASDISVDDDGLVHTVTLRDDVRWHDGEVFTAEDVVKTYELIQNPEVRSPLEPSWDAVKVAALDEYTVTFTLPNVLSSFKFSLVNGIVPAHIMNTIDPADLRSSTFNTVTPIGTGPFTFDNVEVVGSNADTRYEKVTLQRNDDYYFSPPKIDGMVIRSYRIEDPMIKAFENKEISAMVGLYSVSDQLIDGRDELQEFSTPTTSSVMLFLNNGTDPLNNKTIRRALAHGTDTDALRSSVSYPLVKVDSPFLRSHFAYDPDKTQTSFDVEKANELLEQEGWVRGEDGIRRKEDRRLSLRLVSQSLTEYASVSAELQKQWQRIGVELEAVLQPEADIQSGAIAQHNYEVLLYGIALGPDPDVFAYWHSSQADPRVRTRLNLSEYENATADEALEAGRTRFDTELRKSKYQPFLDAWIDDVPAIALYQPRFLYVVQGPLEGYRSGQFTNAVDRFYTVTDWQIRREKTVK